MKLQIIGDNIGMCGLQSDVLWPIVKLKDGAQTTSARFESADDEGGDDDVDDDGDAAAADD